MVLLLVSGFMVGIGLRMLFGGVSLYPKGFATIILVAGAISSAIALATRLLW